MQQFPLTLTYARTDYKVQDQMMLQGSVVDLQRPARDNPPSASLYIQLSRVSSLDMTFILTSFDVTELCGPLSDELLAELVWEEEMARKTKRLYDM